MFAKVAVALVVECAVFAAILFASAGTFTWPAGWAFLFLFFAPAAWASVRLGKRDPALLQERMRVTGDKAQPLWDKIFLALIAAAFLAWLALMGFDARFGWTYVGGGLQIVGAIAMLGGIWMVDRVFAENTFAAPLVKVQAERGHKVIDTGPYALVRHPMYSGGAVFLVGCALVLGSWWGVLGAVFLTAAIAWRALGEEATLARDLPGYTDYMRKVRWRLAPGLW
jgi:protein-S-isoprenylcysteine O-methyltransferase Ste14